MDFVFKAVGDVGAVLAGSLVVIGDRLGFYRAWRARAADERRLAERTGTAERARARVAGRRRRLRATSPTGRRAGTSCPTSTSRRYRGDDPAFVVGALEIAHRAVQAHRPRRREPCARGAGSTGGDQDHHVHVGCERFFRPGYVNYLTSAWIPAMDGVAGRLEQGIAVADIGCGHGAEHHPSGTDLPPVVASSASTRTRARSRPRASTPRAPASPTASCSSTPRRRS
jgi:hypothetical protein